MILTFIDFQITFSNMGSYNTPPFISKVVSNCPFTHAFTTESETLTLTGLKITRYFFYFQLMSKKSNFLFLNEVPITATTHHPPKHMHENLDGVMTVSGQSLENIRTT